MASRISSKSICCTRPQLVERLLLLGRGVGEDHLAHHRQAVGGEEHVLGAAQADALGAELAGVGGVLAGVGVGAHAELALADLVGPLEDGVELGRRLGGLELHLAQHDLAAGAVEADDVAFLDDDVADAELLALDLDGLGAHDGGRAPAAGDHGGVADRGRRER